MVMSLAAHAVRQITDNQLHRISPKCQRELIVHHVKQTIYSSQDPETIKRCYMFLCHTWLDFVPCHLLCKDIDFFPVSLSILQREYQKEQMDDRLQDWILLFLEMVSDPCDERHNDVTEIQTFLVKYSAIIAAGLGEVATVFRTMKLILQLTKNEENLKTMARAPLNQPDSTLIQQAVANLQFFLDHHIIMDKKKRRIEKVIEMLTIFLYRCCEVDELRKSVADELTVVSHMRVFNRGWRLLPTVVATEFETDNERLKEYALGILRQVAFIPNVNQTLMDVRHVAFTKKHLPEVFEYFWLQHRV